MKSPGCAGRPGLFYGGKMGGRRMRISMEVPPQQSEPFAAAFRLTIFALKRHGGNRIYLLIDPALGLIVQIGGGDANAVEYRADDHLNGSWSLNPVIVGPELPGIMRNGQYRCTSAGGQHGAAFGEHFALSRWYPGTFREYQHMNATAQTVSPLSEYLLQGIGFLAAINKDRMNHTQRPA